MKLHFYKFLLLSISTSILTMDNPILIPALRGLDQKLVEAIASNNASEVKSLLDKKANPNIQTGMLETPLILAIKNNVSPDIIKLLLAAGADPNLGDGAKNFPPIMWASKLGNVQAVRLLIDAGIRHDMFFHYSLAHALAEGHEKIVKMLLRAGANPNSELNEGKTLLMVVGTAGLTDNDNNKLIKMMKVLLAHGININAQDQAGSTALMHAVQQNNVTMVRFLLEHGANQTLRRKDGKKALEIAQELSTQQNNNAIIELLQNQIPRSSLSKKL